VARSDTVSSRVTVAVTTKRSPSGAVAEAVPDSVADRRRWSVTVAVNRAERRIAPAKPTLAQALFDDSPPAPPEPSPARRDRQHGQRQPGPGEHQPQGGDAARPQTLEEAARSHRIPTLARGAQTHRPRPAYP
jgi:hypothetical protein